MSRSRSTSDSFKDGGAKGLKTALPGDPKLDFYVTNSRTASCTAGEDALGSTRFLSGVTIITGNDGDGPLGTNEIRRRQLRPLWFFRDAYVGTRHQELNA